MSRSSSRIALIERPIDESIEKHRGGPCADHAGEHEKQCSSRGQAIRRDNERAQGKRQRENCVRETNQPKKPRDDIWSRQRFVFDGHESHEASRSSREVAPRVRARRRESVSRVRKACDQKHNQGVSLTTGASGGRPGNIWPAAIQTRWVRN